jgi:hypothetical protein
MKKAMTLCVLVLIAAQLFAQTSLPGFYSNIKQNQRPETPMALQMLQEHFSSMLRYPLMPPVPKNETMITATKERLDSIIIQYNVGLWIPAQKILFTWNTQNLVIKHEDFEFDDVLMKMVPSSRELYDYNSNGEMIERVYERYDVSINQWIGDYKMAYTWIGGNLATTASWYWDMSVNQWVTGGRGTYHYLPNGLLDYAIFEYWDDWTSQWKIGYKQEVTYNTSNQIILDLYSFYDETQQQFYPGSKVEYIYHANGKVSKIESAFYDTFLMFWTPEGIREFTYDANANQTSETASYYDPFMSVWIYSYKEERTFDALHNMTSEAYYYFDEMISAWVTENKTDYTYDNAYPFASLLIPNTFTDEDPEVMFRHKITKLDGYYYDPTVLTWMHNMKGDVYWSTVTIGVEQPENANMVNLYPNPAKTSISISGDLNNTSYEFKLIDMQGRVVMHQMVFSGDKIEINNLKPGLYLYQIGDGIRQLQQNKLMIIR